MKRLVVLLLLVAACVVAVPFWMWQRAGPNDKPLSVQIPEGATIISAARTLETAGAVRSADWFRRLATRLGSGDPIKAGEFAIPAGASAAQILDILQHGRAVQRLVNIPEGMPSILVYEKINPRNC